ncbi:MAG TPA: caspase family protein, partial [Polyangiales bacterium]
MSRWAHARCWLLCAWLLSGWQRAPARADEAQALRRFALLIAANDGGPSRPPLRHAVHDARAVGSVLSELGGVSPEDTTFLLEPGAASVRTALEALQRTFRQLAARGARSELVLYYSGHSDEYGLLLGAQRLAYQELRGLLRELGADVRIAILDSCASGAFTREKGGKLRAPFMEDVSSAVRGHAFLTSASEDEAAQESDTLGGSFFTHFLVSGLRGAADSTGDGKVTLTEAYRYAFEETLAHTGRTRFGAQHPAYDIRLVGTGDLVLTDLRSTASELILDEPLEGRVFVRDEHGHVLVELDKGSGKARALGLPPGRYQIELAHEAKLWRASFTTSAQAPTHVAMPAFRRVERLSTSARGAVYRVMPAAAALVAQLSTNRLQPSPDVLNHFNFSLVYDRPAAISGVQLSVGAALVRDALRGLQLAPGASAARSAYGLQLGAVAYAEELTWGVQAGAITALAAGHLAGLQVAAVAWSRSLAGVQLGGLNVAERLHGVQLGVINIATGHVRGVSIGLINVARRADASLAPIAYTHAGGAHAQLSIGDTSLLNVALRLDATYNYSFISVAVHPVGPAEGR